jgi:SOS response regulatory protein OraA/RecX
MVSEKLALRGYAQTEIDDAINVLKSEGFINDKAFAIEYAAAIYKKGRGPVYIRKKLMQFGIDGEIIKDATLFDPHAKIIEIFNKKYKRLDKTNKGAIIKCAAFFLGRGFVEEDIKRAFALLNIDLTGLFESQN